MESGKTVIVIGGGIGGLSLAAMLGKKGFHVTLLEKNEMLGGRAGLFKANGFTFDMGPSWYLMPDVFEHYFDLMGEKIEDHLALKRLTPSYRIFFKDSPAGMINMYADREKDGETFEKLEPGSSVKFDEYLRRAKLNYEISKESFMYKNYDSIFDFLTLRVAIQGTKLSVFSTMDRFVRRFFKTETMQKIMQYTLVFLGSSPYNTPALYSIMTYIDFGMGVFYPTGGIYKIIESLVKIGEKNGVHYRTSSPVAEILTENGKAIGVRLESGEILSADIIVSNADIHHTETKLLKKEEDREHPESVWEKKTLSPSAFIMYLGFKDRVPSLTHHNLLFSRDWHKNFGEIFDHPQWPTDPSLYVCAPSVTDPSVAPEGKENLFVLVPMAPGIEYTEDEMNAYGEKILDLMQTELSIPNIRERIEFKRYFCGKDFKERYNSYKGSALGLAHTLMQTAIFRPNTISKKVKNLYYVGANTNPGIGMPICLISAELVYKRLIGDKSDGPLKSL